MSAANGSAVPGETVTDAKGKGKALDQVQGQDMSMDEDEDSSEGEESGNEPVSSRFYPTSFPQQQQRYTMFFTTIIPSYSSALFPY